MGKKGKYLKEPEAKKGAKGILWLIIGLCAIAIVAAVFIFVPKKSPDETPSTIGYNKITNPEEYTWEQYQAMMPEEKMLFPDNFESMDAFNAWYDRVQPTEPVDTNGPTVNLPGKNAEEFTWEEYQALTPEEQMLFPDYFESMDAYHVWYERVKPQETEARVPEIELGDKKPEDYTWEDYQQLSIEEKMFFPDYFESYEAYQEWYDRVCPEN